MHSAFVEERIIIYSHLVLGGELETAHLLLGLMSMYEWMESSVWEDKSVRTTCRTGNEATSDGSHFLDSRVERLGGLDAIGPWRLARSHASTTKASFQCNRLLLDPFSIDSTGKVSGIIIFLFKWRLEIPPTHLFYYMSQYNFRIFVFFFFFLHQMLLQNTTGDKPNSSST